MFPAIQKLNSHSISVETSAVNIADRADMERRQRPARPVWGRAGLNQCSTLKMNVRAGFDANQALDGRAGKTDLEGRPLISPLPRGTELF